MNKLEFEEEIMIGRNHDEIIDEYERRNQKQYFTKIIEKCDCGHCIEIDEPHVIFEGEIFCSRDCCWEWLKKYNDIKEID